MISSPIPSINYFAFVTAVSIPQFEYQSRSESISAFISGAGLGLGESSLSIFGLQSGTAAIGGNGEHAYVSVATGNLVLQRQDELLLGPGLESICGMAPARATSTRMAAWPLIRWSVPAAWALQARRELGYVSPGGPARLAASLSAAKRASLMRAYTTLREFDAAVRVVRVTVPMGGVTATRYDAFGNAIAITDPRGNAGSFTFDAANRVIRQTDPEGHVTETAYTTSGKTARVTQGDADTRFVYDKLDRLLQVTDAEGFVESYVWDSLSNRISVVNKIGGITRYGFDANGRVTSETLPVDGIVKRYDDDARGNRVLQVDAAGLPEQRTTRYDYDAAILTAWPTSAEDRITRYRYDRNDRNGRLLEQSRGNVAYGTVGAGGLLTGAMADASTRYAWNGLGLMTQKIDANGDATDIAYDPMGRKLREQGAGFIDFLGNAVRPTTDTSYDALGNVRTSIRRACRYTNPDP